MTLSPFPGDLVWIAPETWLYDDPDVSDPADDAVGLNYDWDIVFVVSTSANGWTLVLRHDDLVFVGTRCLMSIDGMPDTINGR